ncbi:MAG: YdcF family protein [Acidimicrobiaceae bacterium]|nr:YdcF family protein [Acidimicrobiia bacterium]MCY4494710.1 YdcF family protein [Acidimicrobiaceae bacterium]
MRRGRFARLSARRIVWALAIVGALVVGYLGINFIEVRMNLDVDDRGPADAIVVLGAAQYDGRPSPVLARRLDHALGLWHEGAAPLIVTTGSKQQGDRFTEGFTGFEYLLEAGVPEAALLLVTDGASTWEQMAATARVLRDRGLSSVVVVSDPYHSLRVAQISSEVGLAAYISPTDGGASLRQLARETAAVSLGRVLGYRRVDNWFGNAN